MIEIDIQNRAMKGTCKAKDFKKEFDEFKDMLKVRR